MTMPWPGTDQSTVPPLAFRAPVSSRRSNEKARSGSTPTWAIPLRSKARFSMSCCPKSQEFSLLPICRRPEATSPSRPAPETRRRRADGALLRSEIGGVSRNDMARIAQYVVQSGQLVLGLRHKPDVPACRDRRGRAYAAGRAGQVVRLQVSAIRKQPCGMMNPGPVDYGSRTRHTCDAISPMDEDALGPMPG